MASTKKYLNEIFGTVLVLSALLSTVSAVDCHGKSFHCVNSTHFMICVDLGGGVSQAIDDFLVTCPPPTVCHGTNHFECEFPAPTTPSTTLNNIISDITQPWEEVVTVSSTGNTTKEFSENYMNTERITAEYSVTTDTTVDLTTATASELYVDNKLNIPEIVATLPAEIAYPAIETTTLNENLNITDSVPTEVTVEITTAVTETVTQTTAESKNLTETGPAIVDETTKTAAEITTDTTVDLTTATASELYVDNKLNTPEIVATLPAEIATPAIETTQTLNENLNITDSVPTEVTVDITTAVIETVTQTTAESKNLTETGPAIVDETTKTAAEITTDTTVDLTTATASELYVNNKLNIPEIVATLPAEIANPAIETTQTLNEKLNITVYVPTEVTVDITTAYTETVTQTTDESKNLTETGPVIVDEITRTPADITTDTTVDLTTATASELYVNNKLNIPEIVATLPAEIATPAIETTQTLNENLNIADYVPTEVTVDITAAVIETVTQTTAESKNLTDIGPAIVDEITKTAAEITTENIIMIDTTAAETGYKPRQEPSAKEQLAQTIHENQNITGTESNVVAIDITTPIIERVIQNTATENVVVDEFTATTTETTTNNIIITDPLRTELGYIESTATEQITLTTTVQSKTKPDEVTILPQKETTDILPKEPPKPQHQNPVNIEKPISSAPVNITSNLNTKNASKTDDFLQNILPAKTTTTLETIVETAIGNTGQLTTIPVDRVTDNRITVQQLNNTIQKSESVNVSEPTKPSTSFEGSLRSNSSIMGNKHSAANEIENKETQMPSIHDSLTPYNRVAGNRTKKVANTTDERVVGSNINSTTLPVRVTTDATYDHDAKENNLNTTINKILNENNYTATNNAPTETTLISTTDTQNLAEATVIGGTWTDTIENGASTEQPTTINEGSLTTDIIQNVVTEYIIVPTRQAVHLENITTDVVPATVSDIPSMSPAFDDNMNNDTQLPVSPVTENIISTINNGASKNGLTSVESVNMNTLTTETVATPTTISNAQSITSFENNMMIETTLPVTENIASTVNNEGSINIFMPAQAVNMDTMTTEALDIPTLVGNTHPTPPAFEDNMKIEISLPVTENIVSIVNNGGTTNGFMTAQAVNMDIITTEAEGIPTAINNTQSMLTAVEDSIKTEAPFGNALATTTENILLIENNEVDKNDSTNAQASDLTTISTDTIYMPTTVTNGQALAFIDIDEDLLPATENIVSSINNGDNTNDFMTSQSINVDDINTEAWYGPYITISNVQPIRPTFKEDTVTDTPLTVSENVASSVNYGLSTNDFTTAQPLNVDEVNTETTHIPTTIRNVPPKTPTIENNMIDVPLPANENILSSANNRASTNGLMTTPAVNLDIITTQATITNASVMPPAFEDGARTEPPLSATKNIVSAINDGVSTNDLTTRKAGLETVVQLITERSTVPPSKVMELSLNNEKPVVTVHGDTITTESGTPFPTINKGSPNNAIQKIQTLINSSANTAVESDVKENYEDNKMTTITNLRENLPEFSLPSKNTPVTGLSVDKSTSHVSQIENVNEQASVYNAATSRTEASPMIDYITRATTSKSIPTIGSDSAFDISNQNLTNPQAESKTTQVNNSLQSRTTERVDQADNIIGNPLANQVLNDLNQNSESIGTSVTNINAGANDRDTISLNTEIISQKGSTGITGSPIYAQIDHTQSIDFITTQRSIGVTGSNDILTTNGYSAGIVKVNSEHETDYRLNSQAKIPVTISLNQKTGKLATAGVDISFVSTAEATEVVTSTEGNKVNKEQRADTISKPVMLDVLPLPINIIQFNAPTTNIPVAITDFVSNVIITDSYITHSTSRPSSIETKIQNSVKVGDVPIVPKIKDSALNFQLGATDKTSDTTTVPAVASSTSNSDTSDFAKTVVRNGDTTFNLDTKSIDNVTPATSRPSSVQNKIQNSVKVGDLPTVPKIKDSAFNFQLGATDKTSDTTTVPAVGSSTSNSDTSVFAKTVVRNGDTTLNLETKSIDEANALSQPSHVEKILNKKTSAPNNAHVIPDTKTGGSGTDSGNPHNIQSPIISEKANTGIIASESVSNYDSQKSLHLTPQETVSNRLYQNSNSTVVTDLTSASQNISFNTKKAPQKPTENDKTLSFNVSLTHQNNSSTNITSSISTKAQNISISTAQMPSQMVTPDKISNVNNNLNKQLPTDAAQTFTCINGVRGRYSDKDDCRKFYICIGNQEPIVGYCPETTVFSDLKKLCTKNMSHCIRENQFKCPSAGRFSDFTKDNVYYICIDYNTKLYRFKFQCQKGYILDKTTVHCIETKEIESNESVSISNDNSSQTSSSSISSNTSSKSISSSSNSNNSSKPDNSSSNNDSSSKSKKSKEAVETSEKSDGNDDDDDDEEVFKCKKEGKFPIRNECRRYYLCKKNRKSEYRRKIKKCNSGKVFHKDKKKCVEDDSYEC